MHLPELLHEDQKVTITRRGAPVAIIVSYDEYNLMCEQMKKMAQEVESMRETIEILQDDDLMESIRESMEAIQRGDTVSLEEARQALGLE